MGIWNQSLGRRTFLGALPFVAAGPLLGQDQRPGSSVPVPVDTAARNAEARLLRAEVRADLARVLVERFLLPIDAWILTGGPGKAVTNVDDINNKRAPDVAPWFMLLIETKPRVAATPLEYRFALDTARRKMTSWCEDMAGEEHEEHGCRFLETLSGYAGRIRENLLTLLVDDLARAVLPAFYPDRDKLDLADRTAQDARIEDRRRLLHEGEGHLYELTDETTPLERAAIPERRLF